MHSGVKLLLHFSLHIDSWIAKWQRNYGGEWWFSYYCENSINQGFIRNLLPKLESEVWVLLMDNILNKKRQVFQVHQELVSTHYYILQQSAWRI